MWHSWIWIGLMGRAEMSKQFDDQVLEELGLDPNAGRLVVSTVCTRLTL